MNEQIELKIKYLENYNLKEWGEIKFANPDDACFDMRAGVTEDTIIKAHGTLNVPLGISADIPSGYELRTSARSGLGFKNGIGQTNGIGVIDAGYKGEIAAILFNASDKDFVIEPGMRLCQGRLSKLVPTKITMTNDLNLENDRKGGFGSTGTK